MKDLDFQKATFSSLSYPVIEEATFSLSRPVVLDLRQEEYRLCGTKRLYAFRESNGFRVRVTDFGGDKVLAEKLIRPISSQGYKDEAHEKDAYSLTVPGEDMRIEIAVQPEYLRHSDFVPWSTAVPHDWQDGMLSSSSIRDLVNREERRALAARRALHRGARSQPAHGQAPAPHAGKRRRPSPLKPETTATTGR